jgi:uncharacterized protein (DUF1330 family)
MPICFLTHSKENTMNRHITLGLALVAGIGIGAAAVQTIHAQSKPHAFVIADINVINQDGYTKEFLQPVTKSILDNGGKFLARGGKTLAIEGEPPKNRVVINEFESLDRVQAWNNSAAYKEAFAIGKKYATFHVYAVEGISP